MKDSEGENVEAGDWVSFAFGIPPVPVHARVVDRDGVLYALTPDHNPKQCKLKDLERYVGFFQKIRDQ